MNKFEKIEVWLLIAILALSGVTAYEVIRFVHSEFEMELTIEQAQEIAEEVNDAIEARKVAEQDLSEVSE